MMRTSGSRTMYRGSLISGIAVDEHALEYVEKAAN
jgi:hypothetical protein